MGIIGPPGAAPQEFALNGTAAEKLFNEALSEAKNAGLPWEDNNPSCSI